MLEKFQPAKKASLQSNTLTVSAMFFYARMLINCVFFFFFPMCLHMIDVRCFFGFPQLPILTAQLTPRLWLLTTTV
jgi:hypothetical protein